MSENVWAKFGGTSMARPELPANIAENNPGMVGIVVSAPGTDATTGVKMTDSLISYGSLINTGNTTDAKSIRDSIITRFEQLYGLLDSHDLASLSDVAANALKPENYDDITRFAHVGEAVSAWAFARLIGAKCLEPEIIFDDDGRVNRSTTLVAIRRQMAAQNGRVVIPGFYGKDRSGRVRLIGRGGSDRTGALYAVAMDVNYENWTDVNGLYTADPRLFTSEPAYLTHEPKLLREVTRDEVREGAHGGTGLLQGDTIVDLDGSGIEVVIRNTEYPEDPGTKILLSRDTDADRSPIIAVSGRQDLDEVTVSDLGMANESGYIDRLLAKMSSLGLSVEHLPTAQDSFSVTTFTKTEEQKSALTKFVAYARGHTLSSNAAVERSTKGVVYVVGEKLRDSWVRTMAMQRLLGDAALLGVGVEDVVSNRLSPSIAFLVQPQDVNKLVDAIHSREILAKNTLFRR